MKIHWPTDYHGVGNSFGFHVHNSRSKEAAQAHGVNLVDVDQSDIVVQVAPGHAFHPFDGKINVVYTAWEAEQIPQLQIDRLSQADMVIVPASYLQRAYREVLPDQVRVEYVPLGVSDDFAFVDRMHISRRPNLKAHGKRRRRVRFLWVGAPNVRKGINHILEAWKAFSGGKYLDLCELYIKTSVAEGAKSATGVTRTGNIIVDDRRVPFNELIGIYHRAHCFVFPSVGEGFGLTAAEAARTGLPVIYTPHTSLTDLFPRDHGIPVKFNLTEQDWSWGNADGLDTAMAVTVRIANADTTDLARKIGEVILNWSQAFKIGRRSSQYISETFTWERTGRELVQLFESLTTAGPETGTDHGPDSNEAVRTRGEGANGNEGETSDRRPRSTSPHPDRRNEAEPARS